MATMTVPVQTAASTPSSGLWTPAYSLWRRELVRFYRQKARVVGVIASPLLFWLVLGSGFAHTFHSSAGPGGENASTHYLGYFFPGAIVMIVLFTAIFSMMSLIQDRNEGFLLSVLAAPIRRSAIVLGKVLGGATLAAIQGWVFLIFAPLAGVHIGVVNIAYSMLIIALSSFALTALGFAIAWPMDSTQAFHAVINLILIPLWLLSGALFPASGASGWLRWVMRLNPLTYTVDALRNGLFPTQATDFSPATNLIVTLGFCAVVFAASWAIVNRRTNKPAA
ncbi:MAG TPA: ABC transporter permease [Acidobacteriaceae bacterium]|jgi:ABC-2 type transport system permease protein|nr:ABC transporter permease [Acidobacteriaceae bacterium]